MEIRLHDINDDKVKDKYVSLVYSQNVQTNLIFDLINFNDKNKVVNVSVIDNNYLESTSNYNCFYIGDGVSYVDLNELYEHLERGKKYIVFCLNSDSDNAIRVIDYTLYNLITLMDDLCSLDHSVYFKPRCDTEFFKDHSVYYQPKESPKANTDEDTHLKKFIRH